MFVLLIPLNQGLKLKSCSANLQRSKVCFADSIKSRIETNEKVSHLWRKDRFVLLIPLNQGLKQDNK